MYYKNHVLNFLFSILDVMGFLKKISKPEIGYQGKSTFYVQKICLTDSTGKVSIGLSAKKKKEVGCVDNRDVNLTWIV